MTEQFSAKVLSQEEAQELVDSMDKYQEDHKDEIAAEKEKRRLKYEEAARGGTFTLVKPIDFIEGLRTNAKDDYGYACFDYAVRWATLMEVETEGGITRRDPEKIIPEVAQEASSIADVEGISGFMYGVAVSMLASCWVHGEILKKWHNGRYGAGESEGVVNPAIMNIRSPE